MQKMPYQYLYVAADGELYFKEYRKKKENTLVNAYMLNSIPVIFAKDSTTETLFKIVEKNPGLEIICQGYKELSSEFYKETNEELYKGKLDFYWYGIELEEGILEESSKCEVNMISEEGITYGIEFSPVYKLKNLKINIDYKCEIREHLKTIKTFYKYPTLFNVLYGFFWETTFFGTPENREEEKEKMKVNLDNIKSELKLEEK